MVKLAATRGRSRGGADIRKSLAVRQEQVRPQGRQEDG